MNYVNPLSIPCVYLSGFYIHPYYPRFYSVDCYGKVFSYYKKRFINCSINDNYLKLGYRDELGVSHQVPVHRLVAFHFVPLPPEFGGDYSKATVDHVDGNKLNNYYANLEWVTPEENLRRAWRNGLCKNVSLVKGKSILVLDKETRQILPFNSIAEAERRLNLNSDMIGGYLQGNRQGYVANRYICCYQDDNDSLKRFANIDQLIESCDKETWRIRPVICHDNTNNATTEYPTMADCAEKTGLNVSTIASHLNRGSRTPIFKRWTIVYKD